MATNWNAVLANVNNSADILAILRKVLSLLELKVDGTTINEVLAQLEKVAADGQITIEEALETLTFLDQKIDERTSAFNDAIEAAAAAGAGANGWTADLVAYAGGTQKQFNDSQNNLNLTIINYVNPKMWGAIGDGVADDTQAIKNCFEFMKANNATFYDYSYSEYNFTENISLIAPNQKIELYGNIKFKSQTSYITFAGTIKQIGNIAVAVNKNSKTIELNVGQVLENGDILAIQNSRQYSFNQYRSYYYDGEIKEVETSSGTTVSLKTGIETSYPGGAEDKVFKISPIMLNIDGITFDCNGYAAVRIQLAADSTFNFEAYNNLNLTNASYGVLFDRVYKSHMTGGRAVKLGAGNSGTDYGIVAANCQDLLIEAKYMYAHRHAGAMGGSDEAGAIPNRRVYFERCQLENSNTVGVHCADIHGNSINCHYKNCDIKGLVGLSGDKCYSIENTITVNSNESRSPVFMIEVSGDCGSIRDTFLDCGSATHLCGWASSITGRLNNRPYSFSVENAKIGKNNLSGIIAAVTVGSSASQFIVDGFEFLGGVLPAFTRIITYSENGGTGVTVTKPSFVQASGQKNALPESTILIVGDGSLPGVKKKISSWYGTNANGDYTINEDGSMTCRATVSATVAVNTAYSGAFKSANINWTYPKPFQSKPKIAPMLLDDLLISTKQTNLTGATSAQIFGVSLVSSASATVTIDLVAVGRFLS
ncbi:hypothetical protein [Acinetobacter baumannii]|uniref:phage tailspike polysaccharide lyase family protein n=1 Tax=Acinetobacter baumannii TaxID=470 RepID=UPI002448126A|nr:hypothetical protein [Acinetobacter baumannii]MDH2613583.1 hypothetical protein [Acinetobacter baumannii]MDH2616727.1 hypothetical protein [Acinetobacter baumannii]